MKIAIDGTAASGKGTLSEHLSKKLKLPRLDTGLLYRKLAFMYIKSIKVTPSQNAFSNGWSFSFIFFQRLQIQWTYSQEEPT